MKGWSCSHDDNRDDRDRNSYFFVDAHYHHLWVKSINYFFVCPREKGLENSGWRLGEVLVVDGFAGLAVLVDLIEGSGAVLGL